MIIETADRSRVKFPVREQTNSAQEFLGCESGFQQGQTIRNPWVALLDGGYSTQHEVHGGQLSSPRATDSTPTARRPHAHADALSKGVGVSLVVHLRRSWPPKPPAR